MSVMPEWFQEQEQEERERIPDPVVAIAPFTRLPDTSSPDWMREYCRMRSLMPPVVRKLTTARERVRKIREARNV